MPRNSSIARTAHVRRAAGRRSATGAWSPPSFRGCLGPRRRKLALALAAGATLFAGCRQDMHDAPRFEPYEKNTFFADGRSERPLVPGTVARGRLGGDVVLETGMAGRTPSETLPAGIALTPELLARGRERYDVFCSPCHGRTGAGNGMVVQRGFRRPPSMHVERLRNEAIGYFFDVATRGFGAMPDYAGQVNVNDRWAIAAYVRALQLSQNAPASELPESLRARLRAAAPAGPGATPAAPAAEPHR